MHIVCFLHSTAGTGDFIGMESLSDITEVYNIPLSEINLQLLNADLEEWLSTEWFRVKDSWFKVEVIFEDDRLIHPSAVEMFDPILASFQKNSL